MRTSRRAIAALYRPSAGDDDRAAYWQCHVRIGVVISEVAFWSVLGCVLMADSPGLSA